MRIEDRAKKIKCILFDVDGTLTDGGMIITGERKKDKRFDIKDGLGMFLWKQAGFKLGFITGDDSEATKERAKILNVDYRYFGCLNKRAAIKEIIETSGFEPDELAFVGDDLIDIPCMRKVGFAVAVGDAASELDNCIHYKTKAFGGKGAAREIIEMIFRSKGLWDETVQGFYSD